MVRCICIVAVLFSGAALYAQDISPIEAWTRTNGSWIFDGRVDNADYVWRYRDHTISRTALFIIEQIAAPNLAQDNVVAWAYNLSDIRDGDTQSKILEQLERGEVALAFRNSEDRNYYVIPESQRTTLFPRQSDYGSLLSDDWDTGDVWDVWVVSPEMRKYALNEASGRQLISNWNERPLPDGSSPFPWQSR